MPFIVTAAIALLLVAALGPALGTAWAEPHRPIVDGKRIQPRADNLAHIPQAQLSRTSAMEVDRLYHEVLANQRRATTAP